MAVFLPSAACGQQKCRESAVGRAEAPPETVPARSAGRENAFRSEGRPLSDGLTALLHVVLDFSDHDFSWLAQFFSLLVLPFAHEDLAIILGGYIVVNKIMPVGLVALCIYGGMVASDFALYGIGAGARRLPWLTRLAVDDRVRGVGDMLKRNMFGLVAFCRVVPGVVYIAFVACGWMRVPLGRFTVASLLVSALYLPLMLCIVVFFGDALDDRAGLWTWPFLLCVLVAIGFLRRQVFAFQEPSQGAETTGHRGMAALVGLARKMTLAERIPTKLFYLPLAVSWIGFGLRHRSLTLPTAANPGHPAGGWWGASRSNYLRDVAAPECRWIADFVVVQRSTGLRTLYADLELARQSLSAVGLGFPLIAKPDTGRPVARRIDDVSALRDYLRQFPVGKKLILQRLVPYEGRATVLYARLPGTRSGRILSLAVCADGRRRDARRHITPELEARMDAIARSMREFHYGRFELRFASLDDLERGESLSVVEINGIEAVDARDPLLPFVEIFRRSVDRQRIMFLIGEKNRARGFKPVGCVNVLKSLIRGSRLGRRSPASA
jgi:membrane protein DedA with SNARE-associated domain